MGQPQFAGLSPQQQVNLVATNSSSNLAALAAAAAGGNMMPGQGMQGMPPTNLPGMPPGMIPPHLGQHAALVNTIEYQVRRSCHLELCDLPSLLHAYWY